MNAGPTSERVYEALKARILQRAWRPGDRLDPTAIGEALNSSVTPARDALNILSGEGLVEARTSEGFRLPPLDAPALEDLYAWNAQVLDTAIRSWRRPPFRDHLPARANSTEGAAALFTAIALRSDNIEHHRCIASLNDRLNAVRISEGEVLTQASADLEAMSTAIEIANVRELRSVVAGYHRTRRRHAAAIVRAVYRALDP